MKQSPVPPGSSPISVRINNIVGEAQTTGVTYVLQPQQQQASLKPGVLRPVTFLQQQQVNVGGGGGGGNNGSAGNGGQVLIRRFPNNNVVQVRRIVNQQHQQQQHQTQHVQRLVVQSPTLVGAPPQQNQVQIQVSASAAGGTGNGKKVGVFSSESESDEFESVGKRVTRSSCSTARNLHQRNGKDASAANGRRKEVDDTKREEDLVEDDEKVKSGKRKRFDDGGDDDDEGDLLVDHAEDEDDQDGDVIDDDDEDGDNEKSAFELNGAGVDSGFLRHVIETQILNRHKTRISDWDGTKGHMCQSCHESFLSENGLEVHRNRRIHHILFFCRYCKRDLSFFNKCRLLQHLRNHRATPTVSSLQNCIMIRLLPESDYLHYQYEDCTSSSEDDEEKVSSPGGGGGGTSSSNGGASSSASKRLKPSRFRRIARSSITGRDSDNSPPPIVCRQIVAPPQQLASPPPAAENTTTIVSTLNNSASVAHKNAIGGTIKYAGANSTGGGEDEQQKLSPQASNQVAVIKSGVASNKATNLEKESSPVDSSAAESPQIRIRNLSQITVTMNEDEDAEDDDMPDEFEGEEDEEEETEKLKNAAVIQSQHRPRGKSPAKATESPEGNSTSVIVTKKEYRCHKCDRFFRFASDLFKHLEETEQVGLSTRSLHRCPNDDIPSWSQCQFVFHTKVFHEKIEPHMCPGCGHESPDYNSLLEHVTNDCFYLSQRARYMCATAAVSKCSFSDRKCVKTEPEIIDHLKKEHSRSVLQCLHCTQGFATDNWLLKHLSETHGIHCDETKSETEREALINKTTRPLTQCLICNILFPNGPTYLQHVYLNFHMHILHAKMLECQNCFAVFETNEEIFAHRKENEECRKLNPFEMKISEGSDEIGRVNSPDGQGQISSSPIAPATIKIVANPSVVVTKGHQQPPQLNPITQQPSIPKSQSSSMITVVSSANTSTNGSQPPRLSPQVIHQRSQIIQQKQTTSNPNASSQSKMSAPQNNRNNATNAATYSRSPSPAKKNAAFDDLLSCQFCERLVVFSSLRKHEDQCCGLSTVDPGYCLTCKQHFGDKTRLARHGIVHIQEGLPICLFCNNRHIRPTHPKSTAPSAHENLYALKKHLYSNHTSKILHYPYKCTICNEWCPDKRTCEFHIKDHQFKYRLKAGERDPSPIPMSPEELQKMVKIRRKGIDPRKKATTKTIEVYYCPVCKNREFALESGLARHLKLVHQKNPKSLNLSLLKKASTARRFVVKAPESASSLMVVQQPRPLLRSVVSGGGDGGGRSNSNLTSSPSNAVGRNSNNGNGSGNTVTVSSSSGTNSFTSRFSSSIVLRKRLGSVSTAATTSVRRPVTSGGGNLPQRQLPNTRQRTSTSSSSTARTPPASSNRPPSNFLQNRSSSSTPTKSCRRRDGTITCLKCPEFSCKSENEFCEHVKWKHIWPDSEIQKLKFGSKMEEPTEYWCPECNTNFVAKPSLVRHLKFAHEYIKSAEDYMQKIGYDGKKPLKAHQCEVCYYQCADDREHQQHIRTHGMAFLRLRQQRQMSMSKS